jgi:hypothetical protein
MGVRWFVNVAMNRPAVSTPEAVHRTLQRYDVRPGLRVVAGSEAGTGVLALAEHEDKLEVWPSAVRADELPAGDDDEELWEAQDRLHEERGGQGLAELLGALALHLAAPLVLQAATFSSAGEFGRAKEWAARPGAAGVEVKEVVGLEEADAIVSAD